MCVNCAIHFSNAPKFPIVYNKQLLCKHILNIAKKKKQFSYYFEPYWTFVCKHTCSCSGSKMIGGLSFIHSRCLHSNWALCFIFNRKLLSYLERFPNLSPKINNIHTCSSLFEYKNKLQFAIDKNDFWSRIASFFLAQQMSETKWFVSVYFLEIDRILHLESSLN